MSATPPPTRDLSRTPALLPWREWKRILRWPALVAVGIAATGWFAEPILALAATLLIAAVAVPAAILWSAFILGRASRIPPLRLQQEARRVAALVALLLLLIPANGIPTAGRRLVLRWQGNAAVRALEAHHRAHGSFPQDLSMLPGPALLRQGLLYLREGEEYSLWFRNPDWRLMDSAVWTWDREARRWSFRVDRF